MLLEKKMSLMKYGAALVLVAMATSSCTPIGAAVGAGATVGTAASREGGIGQAWTDTRIAAYINDAWFRYNTDMFRKLTLTVFEGRVLITGSVQQPDHRDAAVRFAWQAPGVRQVINEIRIQPSTGFTGYSKDSWIIAQLRTRLIGDRDIESINYKFDCDNGNIYILGVARDQEELNHVLNQARNIAYVKEVVSYIRLRSETRPDANAPVQRQTTSSTSTTTSSNGNTTTTSTTSSTSSASSSGPAVEQLQPIDPIMEKSPAIQSEDLAPIK